SGPTNKLPGAGLLAADACPDPLPVAPDPAAAAIPSPAAPATSKTPGIVTSVNVARFKKLLSRGVSAKPTNTDEVIPIVRVAIVVQFWPSLEISPVKVLP